MLSYVPSGRYFLAMIDKLVWQDAFQGKFEDKQYAIIDLNYFLKVLET